MLKKILTQLQEGRSLSIEDLAKRLGVRVSAITAQIEYLERLGILRRLDLEKRCPSPCDHCRAECSKKSRKDAPFPQFWEVVLTDKQNENH